VADLLDIQEDLSFMVLITSVGFSKIAWLFIPHCNVTQSHVSTCYS